MDPKPTEKNDPYPNPKKIRSTTLAWGVGGGEVNSLCEKVYGYTTTDDEST